MEKINYKAACRIISQGELVEVMQLLKDMGINPKNKDGSFKKFSMILDEISKYFNRDCTQYSTNVRENIKEIFADVH